MFFFFFLIQASAEWKNVNVNMGSFCAHQSRVSSDTKTALAFIRHEQIMFRTRFPHSHHTSNHASRNDSMPCRDYRHPEG